MHARIVQMFKRSLLLLRTQIDNRGVIIASSDSDILRFNKDTYSYVWPRDGAFVAIGLDAACMHDALESKIPTNLTKTNNAKLHITCP